MKLTALAPVAALTVAVIVLAPTGPALERQPPGGASRSSPPAASGTSATSSTPPTRCPWITDVGPLTLPGPERLEEAREPFSVAHYATDFDVWKEYFGPGLHDAFGVLWPIVIGAAIAGMAFALARRLDPIVRALGAVGLFGVLAYLFTPLGAAGTEGMPVAFEINVRFAIPALLLGLTLFAIAVPGPKRRGSLGACSAGRSSVLAITNDPFSILDADERAAGRRDRHALRPPPRRASTRSAAAASPAPPSSPALAVLGAIALAAGYLVQDSYLEDRFEGFESEAHIDDAWRFANGLDGARIGLAGTTAGFYRYGFYGGELGNEVVYLGRKGAKGAFSAIPDCAEFRDAVNDAGLDYLVTSPRLNFDDQAAPLPSPEEGWLGDDPPLAPVCARMASRSGRSTGELDPASCESVPLSSAERQPPSRGGRRPPSIAARPARVGRYLALTMVAAGDPEHDEAGMLEQLKRLLDASDRPDRLGLDRHEDQVASPMKSCVDLARSRGDLLVLLRVGVAGPAVAPGPDSTSSASSGRDASSRSDLGVRAPSPAGLLLLVAVNRPILVIMTAADEENASRSRLSAPSSSRWPSPPAARRRSPARAELSADAPTTTHHRPHGASTSSAPGRGSSASRG